MKRCWCAASVRRSHPFEQGVRCVLVRKIIRILCILITRPNMYNLWMCEFATGTSSDMYMMIGLLLTQRANITCFGLESSHYDSPYRIVLVKKKIDSIQKVKACYFSDRQHSLTLKRKSQECPTFHWILGQALSFFMWIMWMSLSLLFVDVVYCTPAEHPCTRTSLSWILCGSTLPKQRAKQPSVYSWTWCISTWARHRLSKEPTLDSSILGSCLCPVISASLSFYADPRLLNHGSHCA